MTEIEKRYRVAMNELARDIDAVFNGNSNGSDRRTGFILLIFPFGGGHSNRCNYISNCADSKEIAVLFREMASKFEGQANIKGRA